MPSVHIENIGEIAVIECEGRIVRSACPAQIGEDSTATRACLAPPSLQT
jgi:hypothetical protein